MKVLSAYLGSAQRTTLDTVLAMTLNNPFNHTMSAEDYSELQANGIKDTTIANFQAAGLIPAPAILKAVKSGVSQSVVADLAASKLFTSDTDAVAAIYFFSLGFQDHEAIRVLITANVPVFDLERLFTNLFGESSAYLADLPSSALSALADAGFSGADFITAMHLFSSGIHDFAALQDLVAAPNSAPGFKVVSARRLFPLDPAGIDPLVYCSLAASMYSEDLSLQRTPSLHREDTVRAALRVFENCADDFNTAHHIAAALFVDVCKKGDASKLLLLLKSASDVDIATVVAQTSEMLAEGIKATATRVQKLFS